MNLLKEEEGVMGLEDPPKEGGRASGGRKILLKEKEGVMGLEDPPEGGGRVLWRQNDSPEGGGRGHGAGGST